MGGETVEEKRARIIAEVAKARMLQLEKEQEENSISRDDGKSLKLEDVIGAPASNSKQVNQNGKIRYDIAMHQKEFGARKFIKP